MHESWAPFKLPFHIWIARAFYISFFYLISISMNRITAFLDLSFFLKRWVYLSPLYFEIIDRFWWCLGCARDRLWSKKFVIYRGAGICTRANSVRAQVRTTIGIFWWVEVWVLYRLVVSDVARMGTLISNMCTTSYFKWYSQLKYICISVHLSM